MVIHDVSQRTLDWSRLHVGIPTASGFHNLVTPEFRLRDGEMVKSYLYLKIAEEWRDAPVMDISTFAIEQGDLLEGEAKPFWELETGKKLREVGFITTDDGKAGCSPDGLIDDDNGLEIKCPTAQMHVKYLLDGALPKDYAAQVHGSMFVTGFPRWTFMSYRRNFPPFILEVQRDEKIIANIREAVNIFYDNMAIAREKMNQWDAREFNQ
jgi:predicted phage-related endonuclease